MPEIEITEAQRDRLAAVQESLEADVVGKYGHVRASDALEYLLDRYEADVGDGEGGGTAGGGETGTASAGETTDTGGSDGQATEATGTDDPAGPPVDEDEEPTAGGTTPDAATDGEGADATTAPAGGDGAALDAMMNLLAEYEDKWGESSSEARYEVELPDGSTEAARTKDDVRGLLFRHYR